MDSFDWGSPAFVTVQPVTGPSFLSVRDMLSRSGMKLGEVGQVNRLTPQLGCVVERKPYSEIHRIGCVVKDAEASSELQDRFVLLNRVQTDGIIGIWGHLINDPVVERIRIGDASNRLATRAVDRDWILIMATNNLF